MAKHGATSPPPLPLHLETGAAPSWKRNGALLAGGAGVAVAGYFLARRVFR